MTLPDFFYIRAARTGQDGTHRIGAIAYTVDKAAGTIKFGFSIVHPNDRGPNFAPVGCMGRAFSKHKNAPVTMTLDDFMFSNVTEWIKTLDIGRFLHNWTARGWQINYRQIDRIGASIVNDIKGIRSDGKTLTAAG
jgi:hypothetical protein